MVDPKGICCIFLDAFSSRYIKEGKANYLHSISENGTYRDINPLFAFEGIGTTIFTGTWPDENLIWTNFILSNLEEKKIKRIAFRSIFPFFSIIPNDRISWDLRFLMYKLLCVNAPIPNQIPPRFLLEFDSVTDKDPFSEEPYNPYTTIFDVLREKKSTFNLIRSHIFQTDNEVLKIANCQMKNNYDFFYFKIGSLDYLGHIYGPTDHKVINKIQDLDSKIRNLISLYEDQYVFLFFSDHGMSPIKKRINFVPLLKKIPLRIHKDYTYFIDSTMMRFWAKNYRAYEKLNDFLRAQPHGILLGQENYDDLHVPLVREISGDIIYALKEFYHFYPDFFHKNKKLKGMHGYFNTQYDNPVLISNESLPIPKRNLDFIGLKQIILNWFNY